MMTRHPIPALFTGAILGATCLAPPAHSASSLLDQTFVFRQGLSGYTGTDDTSIFSENQNAGGGNDGIFSGTTQQLRHRRGLIRFDLGSVPPEGTVISVSLQMVVERSGGNFGNFPVDLHFVTTSWGEGDTIGDLEGGFGGTPAVGDATWISNHHGVSEWDSPGSDFVATPSASEPAGQTGDVVIWSGLGMASDVQGWISNPGSNFGWAVVSGIEGEVQRVKKFYSSEATQFRPELTVVVRTGNPEDLPFGFGTVVLPLTILLGAAGYHLAGRLKLWA